MNIGGSEQSSTQKCVFAVKFDTNTGGFLEKTYTNYSKTKKILQLSLILI